LGLLVILLLVGAISEMVSLGAVVPFIGVLIAPDRVFSQQSIRSVAETFGLTEADQLRLLFTIVFVFLSVASGVIRLLLMWSSTRLAFVIGVDLSFEAYKHTLYQPYAIHVAHNSSELISGITTKVWNTVGALHGLLTFVSAAVILSALMLALIVIDPFIVLVVVIGFGVPYGLIAWATRYRLETNSQIIAKECSDAVKALQEGMGGIRDVLLNWSQSVYSDIFHGADQRFRSAQVSNLVVSASPRFCMEAVGTGLIAVLAYGLNQQTGGITNALPVFGALALGAQRLLPVLQQIYSSWASIVGNKVSLAEVIDLLDQPLPSEATEPEPATLHIKENIRFDEVRFRYSNNGPWVLDGLNLTIPKGTRVGFVGATGSGKSTAMDLLMGLLDPNEGQINVDGLPINGKNRRAWQQSIAHVSQSIFLADATVAENIAFGVPYKTIDIARVRQVAQQAQIAEFIESNREGYEALVGERGMRLSGGQRQRIGIARALYKNASLLVFDEATSALDNSTEHAVMQSIEGLNRDLTILLIAHRLSTVQSCDQIIELEHGHVVAQGTYDQLLEHSPSFRTMAGTVS
jgi:ATP-binding cassette subfamily B protein